jgi:hypothetical protein
MDLQSLVGAHLHRDRRPAKMDADAEERYYRDQVGVPRPRLGRLVYVAAAGLILLAVGVVQT